MMAVLSCCWGVENNSDYCPRVEDDYLGIDNGGGE